MYKYSTEDFKHIKTAITLLTSINRGLAKSLTKTYTEESHFTQNETIELFRDSALALETIDFEYAYILMSLAHKLGPNRPFIKRKMDELKNYYTIEKTGICKLNGLTLEIGEAPPRQLLKAFVNGNYEKSEVTLLKTFLDHDEIVLEVGAGIGYMGLVATRLNKYKRYVAYEANPHLIKVIKNNMTHNNAFFEIHQGVLLNENRKIPFFITDAFWASSLLQPMHQEYKEVIVEGLKKNGIMQQIQPTMLIVDIEGGEADFFNGLDLSSVTKIILEIHPQVLEDQILNRIYGTLLKEGFLLNFKVSYKNVIYWYR